MSDNMPSPLIRQIADFILRDLRDCKTDGLPGSRILAERYGVSYITVLKAARFLRAQNHFQLSQGRSIKKIPVINDSLPEKKTAAEHLFENLREKIFSGEFRKGQILPKISLFSRSKGFSEHTVSAAYRKLMQHNLIHKDGRLWIAGPKQDFESFGIFAGNPLTILVLLRAENRWDIFKQNRTAPFYSSFSHEAMLYGVKLVPFFTGQQTVSTSAETGLSSRLSQIIKALDTRYAGSLIAGTASDFDDMSELIKKLTIFKKPVVWFDPEHTINFDFSHPLFTHCHFYEPHAIELALNFLESMGHRNIGFPCLEHVGWMIDRKQKLEQAAAKFTVPLKIHSSPVSRTAWPWACVESLFDSLRLIRKGASSRVRGCIDLLLVNQSSVQRKINAYRNKCETGSNLDLFDFFSNIVPSGIDVSAHYNDLKMIAFTPYFSPYLFEKQITALLAPNDEFAKLIGDWLTTAGVNYPGDISVLSFDNYVDYHFLNITSIDFGFGYLGYAAFHSISKDLPVSRDTMGKIQSKPLLARRGSVGLPSNKPFGRLQRG